MKKKPKEGRPLLNSNPLKWNTIVQKLETAFAWGSSIEEACLYAGIAKQSFYNHFRNQPKFLDRFEALRCTTVILARIRWIRAFESDPSLARDYVIKKRPWEFGGRGRKQRSEFDQFRKVVTPERNEEMETTLRKLGVLMPTDEEFKRRSRS